MAKYKKLAVWYFFTTLVSIFSICTIRIFDGYRWPFYAVTANAVFSLAGLVLQMHMNDTLRRKALVKIARFLLLLNSVSVLLMLAFSLFILSTEYYNPQTPDKVISSPEELRQAMAEHSGDTVLIATENLYIYAPEYSRIDFVAGNRPSKDDGSIQLCMAAAFQQTYQLGFRHDNIVGWHTADGQLERGKPKDRLGAFTFMDGTPRIWGIDEAEEAVKAAAEKGGSGYQQFIALYGGKRGGYENDEFRCYRALAIVDGRACVIDSRTQMRYGDFVTELEKMGIQDALYGDMGSGWNYSWYRNARGEAIDMIGTPWPFSHNWIVFRK